MKKYQNIIGAGILTLLVIVGLSATIVSATTSSEGYQEKKVAEAFEDLQVNQERRAELRPAVEEDKALELDNAKIVGRMEVYGYTMDWAQNKPVPLQ